MSSGVRRSAARRAISNSTQRRKSSISSIWCLLACIQSFHRRLMVSASLIQKPPLEPILTTMNPRASRARSAVRRVGREV